MSAPHSHGDHATWAAKPELSTAPVAIAVFRKTRRLTRADRITAPDYTLFDPVRSIRVAIGGGASPDCAAEQPLQERLRLAERVDEIDQQRNADCPLPGEHRPQPQAPHDTIDSDVALAEA
jgi:hypothetical protein